MKEGFPRRRRVRNRSGASMADLGRRPDRPALWALLIAIGFTVLAVATAHAASGGITPEPQPAPEPEPTATAGGDGAAFGSRVLRVGMAGDDVTVLNGIVKSKAYAGAVRLTDVFEGPTAGAVREFQRRRDLRPSGVVGSETAKALTRSMKRTGATWYGPGLYGNSTACGRVLRRGTIGVAHRSLPCGTKVTFAYHGHYLVVPVIDRGPYSGGYDFDLTNGAREALGFDSSDQIRYAVAR
jgi:hypothetical protein